MNAKAKGTRNEHRSIQILEAAGYACIRAAASLGTWDIIGVGLKDVVPVQVKTRDWPGAVEMETLRLFPAPSTCRKLVHAGAIVSARPTFGRCRMPDRVRRPHEVYALDCHACLKDVELPTSSVNGNKASCPHCGAELEIRWREDA